MKDVWASRPQEATTKRRVRSGHRGPVSSNFSVTGRRVEPRGTGSRGIDSWLRRKQLRSDSSQMHSCSWRSKRHFQCLWSHPARSDLSSRRHWCRAGGCLPKAHDPIAWVCEEVREGWKGLRGSNPSFVCSLLRRDRFVSLRPTTNARPRGNVRGTLPGRKCRPVGSLPGIPPPGANPP